MAKGIIGRNAKDSGEFWFGEEGLTVVYCGYAHVESGVITLGYVYNRCRKVINHSIEINDLLYLYWCISQVLGISIFWLTLFVESDG